SKRTAKLVLSASIEASSESEASDRFSSQRVCHVVFHPIALRDGGVALKIATRSVYLLTILDGRSSIITVSRHNSKPPTIVR
ncbi:MAG: hypothetical protein ABSD90_16535, partial [Methylocystis sp.]